MDRIKTIGREDEVLAQSSATQEKCSKQRMDRRHIRIKTISREDKVLAQLSATQEKFSKQRKDRKHITTQQEWVDRIKIPAVEEEASSATEEKSSKQRPDRIHITNAQQNK